MCSEVAKRWASEYPVGKRIILACDGAGSPSSMVYETKVTSLKELFEELQNLESDEGVRILTSRAGVRRIVFVTRHSGRFAIAICGAATKGRRWVPGKTLQFKEFFDQRRLREFLTSIATKPLKAYIY